MNKATISTEYEEDTQKGRYLTFTLGEEIFGIEILHVTEIVGMQSVTAIPEVPLYVKGIINLRGQIIPVMDMRLKFRKKEKAYDNRTCIIVVDIEGMSVGLIVDKVSEVLTINEESIVDPPDYRTGFQNNYIQNIGMVNDGVILLLDCEKILTNEELLEISEAC